MTRDNKKEREDLGGGFRTDQDKPETTAEEADRLIGQLRLAMVKKMTRMAASLPAGYYTEIKGQISRRDGITGTWKLRDFAASLKDLAAIGGKGESSGPDTEDWAPLTRLLGGNDDENDEDED